MPQSSDLLEDVYLHNVKFYEGWTESLLQSVLNVSAIADLGIESPVQYVSFALSMATLTKCLADRISYLKHDQEPKPFSITFLIDFLEVIVMFSLCFLGIVFLILTNNDTIPVLMSFPLLIICVNPIIWFTLMRFTRFISNTLLYHIFAIYLILAFGLNYLFNFVSFIRYLVKHFKFQNCKIDFDLFF